MSMRSTLRWARIGLVSLLIASMSVHHAGAWGWLRCRTGRPHGCSVPYPAGEYMVAGGVEWGCNAPPCETVTWEGDGCCVQVEVDGCTPFRWDGSSNGLSGCCGEGVPSGDTASQPELAPNSWVPSTGAANPADSNEPSSVDSGEAQPAGTDPPMPVAPDPALPSSESDRSSGVLGVPADSTPSGTLEPASSTPTDAPLDPPVQNDVAPAEFAPSDADATLDSAPSLDAPAPTDGETQPADSFLDPSLSTDPDPPGFSDEADPIDLPATGEADPLGGEAAPTEMTPDSSIEPAGSPDDLFPSTEEAPADPILETGSGLDEAAPADSSSLPSDDDLFGAPTGENATDESAADPTSADELPTDPIPSDADTSLDAATDGTAPDAIESLDAFEPTTQEPTIQESTPAEVPTDVVPADEVAPAEASEAPSSVDDVIDGLGQRESPPAGRLISVRDQHLPRRFWSDSTGQFHTTGQLVDMGPHSVRILKDNGRFSTVPLNRLSRIDRAYVRAIETQLAPTGSVAAN